MDKPYISSPTIAFYGDGIGLIIWMTSQGYFPLELSGNITTASSGRDADYAKRPATDYGARPSWAIIPSWSL